MVRKVFFLLVLSMVLVSALAASLEAPEPVSPGSQVREETVAESCPTFSWSAVAGAGGYGLVVYEVTRGGELGGAVIERRLSAGVSSWTPPLNQGLLFGGSYAWTVGAVTRGAETLWSEPAFFKVAPGPSAAEFEEALRIVQSYLGAQGVAVPETAPQGPGETVALPPTTSEPPTPLAPPPGTQMSVEGNLDATSFSGAGALLTDLDPENLAAGTAAIDISGTAAIASDLVGAASVSESELDFDVATQTEMTSGIAAHAGEVDAHHILPTELPPSGAAGGDLTGTYPNPGVTDGIARDTEVTAGIATHGGLPDAHREHATLEESAEIDADVGVHAALPNIHHVPTVNTDTVLTEAQVEAFVTDGPLDGSNFTNLNASNVSTGTVAEARIADEMARDAEVASLVAAEVEAERHCRGSSGSTDRYTDCGNGTVRDNNTGLIWLKNANCFGVRLFSQAGSDAASLANGACGLTDGSVPGDWRLPEIGEFCSSDSPTPSSGECPSGDSVDSLLNTNFFDPAVSNAAGDAQWTTDGDAFVGVPSGPFEPSLYMSGTELAPNFFWNVSLPTGEVALDDTEGSGLVWPVRSGSNLVGLATQADLEIHEGAPDSHREHATLEESAEIDTDIATHAALPSVHHALPTGLPPTGAAGGELTGSYPNPGVIDDIARDTEVTAGISAHAAGVDEHREHATLEESAEIDADVGVHAALPSVHHVPTVDTDTVLTEAQVETFVTNDPLDMGNNPITNIGAAGTDFSASGGLTLADDLRINGNLGIGTDPLASPNSNIYMYDGGTYSNPNIYVSGHNSAYVSLERRRTDGGIYLLRAGCGSVNCVDDFAISHNTAGTCVAIRDGCDVDIPALEVDTFACTDCVTEAALSFDPTTQAELGTHAGSVDAHREHATLEESAEIDADIATHAALPNVHHAPTVDTDTFLTEAQVETFVTDGPLDGSNFTDLNASNVTTGTVAEPRIADEMARDAEVVALARCLLKSEQRYWDLGNGTVLDCNTGLFWLRDASCADLAGTDASGRAAWANAQPAAAALASGTCGLTDGSVAGDWRQPTVSELCSYEGIVGGAICPAANASDSLTDSSVGPPTVVNAKGDGVWTESDAFIGVAGPYYWSATDGVVSFIAWGVDVRTGLMGEYVKTSVFHVWPVRGASGSSFDFATQAELDTHESDADAHREHATLEESAEIDSDIGVHAALPNIHHTPTVDTDTVLTEPQVETFVTNDPLDGTNFTNLQWANVSGVPTTTKGDLLVEDGADVVRLPVGTSGQVLVADSAASEGMRWSASNPDPPCFNTTERFVDCSNGTVTDTVTGLVYLKNANCFGSQFWQAANESAAALADGQCGLSDGSGAGDWRLQTRAEWEEIVMPSCAAPKIVGNGSPTTGCYSDHPWATGLVPAIYWSSSTAPTFTTFATWAALDSGNINNVSKTTYNLFVWPVRGGQ